MSESGAPSPESFRPWAQYFQKAVKEGRLGQAYLFLGPEEARPEALLRQLAALLLCEKPSQISCGRCRSCLQNQSENHPDLEILDPETEDGSGVSAEELRGRIQGFLQLRPVQGDRRVVLLFHAGKLSAAAQDALLKPLEEPPPGVLFLISAEDARSVHETVLSRCRALRLRVDSRESTLADRELDSLVASFLESVSAGNTLGFSKKLFGEKKEDLASRREKARNFLRALSLRIQAELRLDRSVSQRKSSGLDPEGLEPLQARALEALADLNQQVTPELAMECLFLFRQRLAAV